MPLCGNCVRVVETKEPMIRVANHEPTIDHYDTFRALQFSANKCELCRAILDSLRREGRLDENPEKTFEGLKLRVAVDHWHCSPHSSNPASSNDISAWGLRAFWVREEMPSQFILCKTLDGNLRPIWTNAMPAGIERVLPTVKTWLMECDETHTACASVHGSEFPALPTRCIDVGDADGSIKPRVFISNGVQARYTTLSHCWGKTLPPRMNRGNLDFLATAIPDQMLPATYQDAIDITRALGIRYIWVDSLCIIQDDKEDWETESANMAAIYRSAYLNIAATSAADSHGGCLHSPRPATSIEIPPPAPHYSHFQGIRRPQGQQGRGQVLLTQPVPPRTATLRPSVPRQKLETLPLNSRAWVLQEVFLSRRTIHFTEDQMYWFCSARGASEDGTLMHSWHPGFAHPIGPVLGPPHWDFAHGDSEAGRDGIRDRECGTMYGTWWALVEDYSSRALGNPSDRMAALAGLTKFFASKLGDEPVAGMWRRELLDGLCWLSDPQRRRSNAAFPGVPSFSWLSVDGPVKRNYYKVPGTPSRERTDSRDLDILSIETAWSGQPLTSLLCGGRLAARGLVAELGFGPEETHGSCAYHHGHYSLLRDGSRVGRFTFDRNQDVSTGVVRCLAVTHNQRTLNFCPPYESVYYWFHALILESTGKEDEYRRIGVGKIWADSGVFDDVEPGVVQIV